MPNDFIKIHGAKVHNLKNISLDLPKNKLVVITGLSGSGKSSLAFDTLYAEGQRRYVESLSAYARQFLGVMDKPDVESITGLSPAIAIDQKSVSKNPRSTVGTITEIYDYLRLLYARVGQPFCPRCGKPVERQSATQIVDQIIKKGKGRLAIILAPLVRGRKGEHRAYLEQAQKAGFLRVRVDGQTYLVEEALELTLDKKKKHEIEAVVDRVEALVEERSRIVDSVETALKLGNGFVLLIFENENKKDEIWFSEHFACKDCGVNLPQLEPRLFSFNSPFGACPDCQGIGSKQEIDPGLLIPNTRLSLAEGAIKPWAGASHRVGRQGYYYFKLEELAQKYNFSLRKPVNKLPQEIVDKIIYGDGQNFEGVIPNLQRRWKETDSLWTRAEIEKYRVIKTCPSCRGRRLRPEALAVMVAGLAIDEIVSRSVEENKRLLKKIIENKALKASKKKIAQPIIKEILNRLEFLTDVGLGYLSLDRSAVTLSGGEAQRIRLATQIGSGLTGVLYILDEPSIGLHQRDVSRLIKTLKYLRDLGNTVVVVEHDDQTILAADWVVEIGPGAGEHGGQAVFLGTPQQLKKANTLTGKYLSGKLKVDGEFKKERQAGKNFLEIIGAAEHNLKNINVKIPLARFVGVSGVSGSGKSTLINDILAKALLRKFYRAKDEPGQYKEIKGVENLDKVVVIDQSPIGRTPRSNPATYTGAFTIVRDLFAQTQEARLRGYKVGRFSFNVKGGRCEACQGEGLKKIEMYFLPDVYVECEECHGRRYNKEALEIEYRGKNIAEVLAMSVEEALDFFRNIPALKQKLKTIFDVGLGYVKLGQPANTLSGGEAQRIKLATELAKKATGKTLYILDEPTTGLHFDDIKKLLGVLHRLVARGNTVLVIEHNPAVLKTADWLIDLGPEGGNKGGKIVDEGTPAQIKKNRRSYTGKWL